MIEHLLDRFCIRKRIGPPGYMIRWFLLVLGPLAEIYIHRFRGPDLQRDSHTHPWLINISIVLKGSYIEEVYHEGEFVKRQRTQWLRVRFFGGEHRIKELESLECWTLFIGLLRYRDWGFYTPEGKFIPNDAYKGATSD